MEHTQFRYEYGKPSNLYSSAPRRLDITYGYVNDPQHKARHKYGLMQPQFLLDACSIQAVTAQDIAFHNKISLASFY